MIGGVSMIVLNKININGIAHPNVFKDSNDKIECIDFVFNIDYDIDRSKSKLEEYSFDEDELLELEGVVSAYLIVSVDSEDLTNIENLNKDSLNYIITSDICEDLEYAKLTESQRLDIVNKIEKYIKYKNLTNNSSGN